MRTKTFNAIIEVLRDGEWHSANEVAERTLYAHEWIDELRREALVETDERDGQLVVRLSAEVPTLEQAVA